MAKLNQIVAVVSGKKSRTNTAITELYKDVQKKDLFTGISRVYRPLADDGETFPDESKKNQFDAKSAISKARALFTDLWDAVATLDASNCSATADISVGNKSVLPKVPVTTLLYLEKQIEDLNTFVTHLPVLAPEYDWKWDAARNCFVTAVEKSNKTKKEMKVLIKYEATDNHPAQTETYNEDVKIGEWNTTRFSGAVPADLKEKYLARLQQLREAVKFAREQANNADATVSNIAEPILEFVFGDRNT